MLDHLTEEQQPAVARKLNTAYALEDYAAAKQALDGLHHELMHLNPSTARSLAEGSEETLTMHRLHVPPQLRLTLTSTNVIESAFSIVERVLSQCETLAQRRSTRTLGRLRPADCLKTVPSHQGI